MAEHYAIAIDIGTSGIRAQNYNLTTHKTISTAITLRHPLPGANVVDHLHFALNIGRETAHNILITTINRVIANLNIDLNKVERLAVCGNPIQLSLFNNIEIRDLALIEMLSSTGMRIGELVLLNRDDVDFIERECKVLGKGDKERIVYFDARTKLHLQEYLISREDDNEALFVGLRNPHNRVTINGIELRIRNLGRNVGIKKCHPHKFRRTMATVAIDKGMPIEQVQKLLGHEKIDTTLHYAMVKQSNVKNAYRKYIG